MELIEYLTIRVYALSIFEYIVFILFFTLAYLALKQYILSKSKNAWKIFNIFLIILFTSFVIYKVLLNREKGTGDGNIVLVPFLSYYKYFKGENVEAFIMGRANILLFIPYGLFFYNILKTKKRVIIFVVVAFVVSLVLEALQYVLLLGTAEMDDVIHNALGAYIGYLICRWWSNSFIFKALLIKLKLNNA